LANTRTSGHGGFRLCHWFKKYPPKIVRPI
jgi:hypothetical protein